MELAEAVAAEMEVVPRSVMRMADLTLAVAGEVVVAKDRPNLVADEVRTSGCWG